ncbi:MAG TPA: hypothetical protein VIW80_16070 [Pyrinomonadaceae bacterium]|jgi:hypothetical protein
MSEKVRYRIGIPRRVLLLEIERRCSDPQCNTRAQIGLTKEDARLYCGFECEQCKRWTSDSLSERDIPDWWEELTITDMHTVRAQQSRTGEEPGELISRMSDDYRRMKSKDEG